MVRILIREGQNVNEKTQNEGNTPLHIAAKNGHYLIVKYLIEIGANTAQQNNSGQTPMQFLASALVTDPAKLDKLVSKCKTELQGQQLRERQKLMGDTLKLLSGAETQKVRA